MKMWSGRSPGGRPGIRELATVVSVRPAIAAAGDRGEQAHAQALQRAAVLSQAELLGNVAPGLDQIVRDGIPAQDDPEIEDVAPLRREAADSR